MDNILDIVKAQFIFAVALAVVGILIAVIAMVVEPSWKIVIPIFFEYLAFQYCKVAYKEMKEEEER